MSETIEQKAAHAILQTPREVVVGGVKYNFAPPSLATLILVSEAISKLPAIRLDSERIVEETLLMAKDCRPVGEIAAILILGSKGLKETVTRPVRRRFAFLDKLLKPVMETVVVDRKEELTQALLEDCTPQEMHLLFADLLKGMQLHDFFGLTTFLTEINLLRPTKVVTEATASGR